MYLFKEHHGIAVDFDSEHDDKEGEGDVRDDRDEGEVADGDEDGEDEAEGARAADRVLPVDQVLHNRLGRGKVDHGAACEDMGAVAARRDQLVSCLQQLQWQLRRLVLSC